MSQKVKLIKEHIHKSIRSLEIENIRLKRQVEQVESGQIAELNTEIERLKEVSSDLVFTVQKLCRTLVIHVEVWSRLKG